MRYYFAPMEGLTDSIYRRAHHEFFGGVDRYYMPFLSPTVHRQLTPKEARELQTVDFTVIPQLLTKVPEDFLWMAGVCRDLGYEEVNLNVGCPSGTVTAKGKGSGMLRNPETVDRFLDTIFSRTEIPISVKTRIGFENEEEWEPLVDIYKKYPIDELIIHPRVRKDFYHGVPRLEAFDLAVKEIPVSLCYNGDITSVSSYEEIATRYPTINKVMIGRGLLAHPNLIGDIKGESPMTKDTLRAYHDTLLADYEEMLCGERDPLFRMKEVWSYMRDSFEESDKHWKKIKKSTILEIGDAVLRSACAAQIVG